MYQINVHQIQREENDQNKKYSNTCPLDPDTKSIPPSLSLTSLTLKSEAKTKAKKSCPFKS